MSSCDLRIAIVLLVLFTSFNERDFVVPPHDIAPVRFIVFFKLCVEFEILSDAHDDVLRRHSWVSLVEALIPLAVAEVEGSHAKSHIYDRSLLSRLVLDFYASEQGVLISGHKQQTTLGHLLKQIPRAKSVLSRQVS